MKKLFTILLVLITSIGYSQTIDTVKVILPIGVGGSTDTTSLSNRINSKLAIADTAGMLANYQSQININTGNIATNTTNIASNTSAIAGKENSLGNPSTNGYVLSSTTAGARSWVPNGSGSSGTVTSVATGYGLTGGTITTSGTVSADSAALSNYYLRRKDSINVAQLNGDTINRKYLPEIPITIDNQGDGTTMLRGSNDTLYSRNIQAGTNITLTQNTDSSVTISASGGGGNADSLNHVVGSNYVIRNELQDTAANIRSSIPAQFNPIAGTNITLSGSYPNITFNSSGGGGTSTIDTTVTATSNGQTNFVFASLPARYLVIVNGTPFTDYTTSGGTTIIVGMSDILTGDKIRLYQTQ